MTKTITITLRIIITKSTTTTTTTLMTIITTLDDYEKSMETTNKKRVSQIDNEHQNHELSWKTRK